VRIRLKEEFQEVLEISFSGQPGLTVRLYHRDRDHRARILCKWARSSGKSKYSCLPLNLLEFERAESTLKICKKRPGSTKVDLWASLNFSTIESTSRMSDGISVLEAVLTLSQDWSSSTVPCFPCVATISIDRSGTFRITSSRERPHRTEGKDVL
jgi:hypothetical protein